MPWQIDITSDNMAVRLNLRRLKPDDSISFDQIVLALEKKKIPIDSDLEKRMGQVLEKLGSLGETEKQPLLVEGLPPRQGEKGRFEWTDKCDPNLVAASKEDDRTSFYERCGVIIVNKAEALGKLYPATAGEAGRDVFGRSIAAHPGTECRIEAGRNVELLADGQTFVSLGAGEPKLERAMLYVDPVVTIKSDVDFSTGNINYSGDINISGDIKDLFKVKTGGDITVAGTIEAAQVDCSGNLTVKKGILGKEKGLICVQKNLCAKYLSNVSVWVHGHTTINAEIVNADLNCRGNVVLEKGAIHGGRVTAAGNVETPQIGSPAAVRTVVRAAVDPVWEKQIIKLQELKARLSETIAELMPQAKMLLESAGGIAGNKLKKLAQKIQEGKGQIEKIKITLEQLEMKMERNCTGRIIVHKIIYPGTVLAVGSVTQTINHEVTGPIVVSRHTLPEQGDILIFKNPAETVCAPN